MRPGLKQLNTRISLVILMTTIASVIGAEERLVTDDGREVLVHEDGSWEFILVDRYATAPDGQRILLQADGNWEYIAKASSEVIPTPSLPATREIPTEIIEQQPTNTLKKAPVTVESKAPSATVQETTSVGSKVANSEGFVQVALTHAFIEEFSDSAGSQSKNKRTSQYMNFYLDISLADNSQGSIDLSALSSADFVVLDDRRRRYDVFMIETTEQNLTPGKKSTLRLVTNSAPNRLFGSKNLSLTLLPQALGKEVSFDLDYREMDKKKISSKY